MNAVRRRGDRTLIPSTPDSVLGTLFFYEVFGGVFRSDLEFPELTPSRETAAQWTLETVHGKPESMPAGPTGEDQLTQTANVRLFIGSDGRYRLAYDDSGTFDVSADGSRLTWYPADAPGEVVRSDVLGRVFAIAHHLAGGISFHASAVAINGRAIVFAAPKLHGKSTIALSLSLRGAMLLSDDIAAVTLGDEPTVLPGVHSVRLNRDSAATIGYDASGATHDVDSKHTVRGLSGHILATKAVPLGALYVLSPPDAARRATGAIERTLLSPRHATMALLPHTRGAALLGAAQAGLVLQRLAAVTSRCPVWQLTIAHDFERLPEAVAELLVLHSAAAGAGTPPAAACLL